MPWSGRQRSACVLVLSAFLSTVAGCTSETQDGPTTIFTWSLWVPALVVLGAFLAGGLGIILLSRSARLGIVLIVLALGSAVLIAPGMLNDKVTVSDQSFMVRTGFWFAPNYHEVPFADLSRIALVTEDHSTRRSKDIQHVLVCHKKSGGSVTVPVSDLMKRGGEEKILQTARSLGIPVVE